MRNRPFYILYLTFGFTALLCTEPNVPEATAQGPFTEDLGHRNWEEVEPGYFIATELVHEDSNGVVFDTLSEFDLQYVRFEGSCEDMTVRELRIGGFVGSTGSAVTYTDIPDEPRHVYSTSESQLHHNYLEAACEKREPEL